MKFLSTFVVASLAVAYAEAAFPSVEVNYDYVDNDVANAKADTVDKCPDLCSANKNCTAYSWSDYQGGTCWLKSKRDQVVYKLGVKSSVMWPTKMDVCQPHQDVDIVGNDLANFPAASVDLCCDMCHKTANCRAYSWSDHQKGTCWLKTKRGTVIAKPGVKSADAYPDNTPYSVLSYDTDYVAHDLTNKPGKKPEDCFEICKGIAGCRAFAWTDQSGGTCWLKAKKDQVISKKGVVAAEVKAPSKCAWKADTDFYDNDLGNAVGIVDHEDCCSICADTKYCKAVAWNNYRGGTCWLKSNVGVEQAKKDVKVAVLVSA